MPGIKLGLAFCEASGACLIRTSGTDPTLVELATKNALALAAGHTLIVFLGKGFYPMERRFALHPHARCGERPRAGQDCRTVGWEVLLHDDLDDVQSALGGTGRDQAVVSIWWD